jgi:hypothetical protein
MDMALSQSENLARAERLATSLGGGERRVEKNVLLSVVAGFMSDPQADLERLKKTIRLLAKGSGGHLRRGDSYREQVEAVVRELGEALAAEDLAPAEWKSIFGWTARLLLVRGGGGWRQGDSRRGGGDRSAGAAGLPRGGKGPKAPPAARLGGLSPKGLSELEQLKRHLGERDEDKP